MEEGRIATVRVKHPDGGDMLINADEYDEKVHGKVMPEPKQPVPTADKDEDGA
jgi:hypothetical protein